MGSDNITPLEPKFTKWYVQYAGTQMVVAYNPKGKYASQFKAIADGKKPIKDLFTLLQTPGLKLGRTDPNIDPQGRDFIFMLMLAQKYYHLPAEHGDEDPRRAARLTELVRDLRRVLAGLDAGVRPARRGQRVHHPGDRAAPELHQAAGGDQPGRLRRRRPVRQGHADDHPAGRAKTTKNGSPQVIDITIVGKPTPAGIAFVAYTLSQAGLAQYKAGGFTLLTADADRAVQRGTQPDTQ